ncbi:MAG TPA: CHAT domain-containing protein, partial [Candidatus Krumholzibacteria bacterium]|nr:CHAT domain-containing protein [Candidatus Krumholzibacteria bacterium]
GERLRAEKDGLEKQLGECQAQIAALRAKPRLTTAERTELASIEEKRDRLVGDIERAGERIRRIESAPVKTVPARITVAKGEALLAYHIGTRSSDLFVIAGGSSQVRAYPLDVPDAAAARLGIPAGPLARATLAQILSGVDATGKATGMGVLRELSEPVVSAASNSITARARTQMQERLHALFTVLMPPAVWKSVHSVREVTIVPDGPLATFPFEACVVAGEKTDPVVFWLDDGPAIRYVPSIATLDALTRAAQPAAAKDVLSVCNPTYASSGASALAPLPGTTRETDAVVSAFGKNRVTVLLGDAATEAAVRSAMPGKAVIHLATHGLVDQRRSDLLAALAFTPGQSSSHDLGDDGFLHLFEIDDASIAAQLVVLSACESSTGNYVLGEGVMAMSRGFLSAGARRVVATEWKVDDDATASLVGDFMARVAKGEHARGGVDYTLALRDAKRTVRRSDAWSQPFYWAAFVLTGIR